MFESREVKIEKIKWNGDGIVEFEFNDGGCWHGAKRKDFWRCDYSHKEWEKVLVKGTPLILWTIQYSIIIGLQAIVNGKTIDLWCVSNDFETEKDEKKSNDRYHNFIFEEGKKISNWIDQGKTLE